MKIEAFTIRSGEKPTTERVEALLADYEALASRIGGERVLRLLDRAREQSKFLPTKDQLIELHKQDSVVDFGGFKATHEQQKCEKCGGQGWVNVRKPVDVNKTPLLTRCGCRTQAAKS